MASVAPVAVSGSETHASETKQQGSNLLIFNELTN